MQHCGRVSTFYVIAFTFSFVVCALVSSTLPKLLIPKGNENNNVTKRGKLMENSDDNDMEECAFVALRDYEENDENNNNNNAAANEDDDEFTLEDLIADGKRIYESRLVESCNDFYQYVDMQKHRGGDKFTTYGCIEDDSDSHVFSRCCVTMCRRNLPILMTCLAVGLFVSLPFVLILYVVCVETGVREVRYILLVQMQRRRSS